MARRWLDLAPRPVDVSPAEERFRQTVLFEPSPKKLRAELVRFPSWILEGYCCEDVDELKAAVSAISCAACDDDPPASVMRQCCEIADLICADGHADVLGDRFGPDGPAEWLAEWKHWWPRHLAALEAVEFRDPPTVEFLSVTGSVEESRTRRCPPAPWRCFVPEPA